MESSQSFVQYLNSFDMSLDVSKLFPLRSGRIATFQINMGRLCNQACRHCHVEAGPARLEIMPPAVMYKCLAVLEANRYGTVDITGGAPEMNPGYTRFVKACSGMGLKVKTRTNLTILKEAPYASLPEFFAENGVEVIGSLPYFLGEMTDRQRGAGVFRSSIEALRRLNSVGYGIEGSPLVLNLVYNPCGAFLPPSQRSIEADFRKELGKRYGITFTNLFTITNMPVGRFLKFLDDSGNLNRYMERLKSSYNPNAAANVMCRDTISVGWDGALYDCDFNQMLGLKCGHGVPDNIMDFDGKALGERRIVTGAHCFGCTAGAGSSCTGSVA
ncbi:MAG: arsenosugar biosynthesis radical SAM protein ArsS [Deltaproteobacteria bacterium]|nr:arsenosugar biosynthesis radical SAM protein ArsS [Deltaproteobacteria bacterium]